MDEIVRQALAKWPNVPHCYGWLGLDARGDWYMRDDRIQAQGPFPHPKGSRILHDKLLAFIHRNYAADEAGAWYFQNGPQRVYVELEATPWVLRLVRGEGEGVVLHTHTDAPFRAAEALLDEVGRVYLSDGPTVGLVHSLDMPLLADAVDERLTRLTLGIQGEGRLDVPLQPCRADELPGRFGYTRSPQAARRKPT